MPDAPPGQRGADCNLLYGMLALQMNFVGRDALLAAMQAWVFDKTQTLGHVLTKQQVLAQDMHDLIEALVQKHLAQHGNDAAKSLEAISSAGLSGLIIRWPRLRDHTSSRKAMEKPSWPRTRMSHNSTPPMNRPAAHMHVSASQPAANPHASTMAPPSSTLPPSEKPMA